jgi:hypothetical protein
MADDEFRLPLSSYDELVKIIRSYGHVDGEVPLPQIANLAGVHATIISRNNAFLVAVGIVEAGQRKVITHLGKGLARALDHNIADEIARHWREVISGNQFFQKLIAAVRIRRGMDEPTLQAHVAYSAGQKKSPGVMAGSAAIVEMMKLAGVVRDENGKLVASDDTALTPVSEAVSVTDNVQAELTDVGQALPPVPARATPMTPGAPVVNVTIQLNIQCDADQLDEVSTKLRNLITRVTGTDTPGK